MLICVANASVKRQWTVSHSPRWHQIAAFWTCRAALAPILGELPDKETQDLVAAAGKLREWQAKLGKSSPGKGKEAGPSVRGGPAVLESHRDDGFQGEFGAELAFTPPRLGPLPDEAMPDFAPAPNGMAGPLPERFAPSLPR
jgi:hypothetical protein